MVALLIRHGSTESFRNVLAGRTHGVHLSAEGKRESALLARCLARRDITAVYSSPLERAVETARIIDNRIQIAVSLNEIDYGEWTGNTFDALNNDIRWKQFNAAQGRVGIPNGETMLEVETRVVAFLEEVSRRSSDSTVAFVSHAGVIRAALCHFAGIALDLAPYIDISPASVTAVRIGPGNPQILMVNQTFDLLMMPR